MAGGTWLLSLSNFLVFRWWFEVKMSFTGDESKPNLIFTYGTLKRGFPNHSLMQSLISRDDAVFLGSYTTDLPLPLVRGPHGVPFLLNLPGAARHHVQGELYAVSDRALEPLDELEGITLGHYERLPIALRPDVGGDLVHAEAYYAHRSFAEDMWRRNGREGFGVYCDGEGELYVRRDARPKDRSFIEEIRSFCSSNLN